MSREVTSSELECFPALDWTDIAPRITAPVRASLEKVLATRRGADLSTEESHALANCEGDDLLGLLVAADVSAARAGGEHRDVCREPQHQFHKHLLCGMQVLRLLPAGRARRARIFCRWRRVAQKTTEAWKIGATEVCIQGGLPRNLPKFTIATFCAR